jgi:hypothetical protein
MPLLDTQRTLREIRNLPFCYLCGQPFGQNDTTNRDHIPPAGLFAKADHNFPLILRAHKHCNSDQGPTDEKIGQLVGLKHGRIPSQKRRRLNLRYARAGRNGPKLGVLQGFHVEGAIQRWIRGFHAALYRVPLPPNTNFAIQAPFPSGQVESGKLMVDELKQQHFLFVEAIKRNRAAHNLDGICCNNRKLRYECVWEQFDNNGPWFCIFAVNLYDWVDLGDINNFPLRGCTGSYWSPSSSVPPIATKGTTLSFNTENIDVADPFGN